MLASIGGRLSLSFSCLNSSRPLPWLSTPDQQQFTTLDFPALAEVSLACGGVTTLLVLEQFWLLSGMQCKVSDTALIHRKLRAMLMGTFCLVYSGAQYMYNILRTIFGHNFTDIPNHLPESASITTPVMLSFFLAWLVHLPFCYFRPYQLRKFFWFKTIVSLPAMFGLFIWAMANTKGRLSGGLYAATSTSSSTVAWMILAGINSGMG